MGEQERTFEFGIPKGEIGEGGFSPEITVVEDTETTYKLKIKTKDAEFDTVNLKGGFGVTGISPGDCTDITAFASSVHLHILWSDPADSKLPDGTLLSRWAGTKLVIKAGAYPENVHDGMLALDNKTLNAYKTEPFTIGGLTDGVTYYCQLFPYSDTNAVNSNAENRTTVTPKAILIGNPSGLSAEGDVAGDIAQIIIKWADPADVIVHGVTVAQWAGTRLVRNEEHPPVDENDGVTVKDSKGRNQYATNGFVDTGIMQDIMYYYALFPYTSDGVFTVDVINHISVEVAYDPFKTPAEEWTYDDGTGNLSAYVKVPKFRIKDVIPGSTDSSWHPAFIVNGEVIPCFWCMKYEAVVINGKAYSKINVSPGVNINFASAKAACEANGSGHHLITNAEYAAIALWSKANGTMPKEKNSAGPSGSTDKALYHNNDLSGIENLSSSVYEWCGGMRLNNGEINIIPNNDAALTGTDHSEASPLWKAIMPDGTLVTPGTTGTVKYTSASGAFTSAVINPVATGNGATLLEALGLIPHAGSKSTDYGDDALWSSLSGEMVLFRGGSHHYGAQSGIFAMRLSHPRTHATTDVGFRAAFIGEFSALTSELMLKNGLLQDTEHALTELDSVRERDMEDIEKALAELSEMITGGKR